MNTVRNAVALLALMGAPLCQAEIGHTAPAIIDDSVPDYRIAGVSDEMLHLVDISSMARIDDNNVAAIVSVFYATPESHPNGSMVDYAVTGQVFSCDKPGHYAMAALMAFSRTDGEDDTIVAREEFQPPFDGHVAREHSFSWHAWVLACRGPKGYSTMNNPPMSDHRAILDLYRSEVARRAARKRHDNTTAPLAPAET